MLPETAPAGERVHQIMAHTRRARHRIVARPARRAPGVRRSRRRASAARGPRLAVGHHVDVRPRLSGRPVRQRRLVGRRPSDCGLGHPGAQLRPVERGERHRHQQVGRHGSAGQHRAAQRLNGGDEPRLVAGIRLAGDHLCAERIDHLPLSAGRQSLPDLLDQRSHDPEHGDARRPDVGLREDIQRRDEDGRGADQPARSAASGRLPPHLRWSQQGDLPSLEPALGSPSETCRWMPRGTRFRRSPSTSATSSAPGWIT